MRKKEILISGCKIAAATVLVWSAGLAIMSFSNRSVDEIDVGVQEAEADIWGLTFAERSKHESFIEVLEESGMEQPRAYDWNGNRVFFSTMTTEKSPRQLARAFQDEFVRKGVNEKAHYDRPQMANLKELDEPSVDRDEAVRLGNDFGEFMAWQDDFWGGGVVPMVVDNDKFQMVGGTAQSGDNDSALDVVTKMNESGETYNERIKAMRYIDAYRETKDRTRVTAVWSDEDLDLMKFANKEKFEDKVYKPEAIPTCTGCERKMRFKGTAGESGYSSNVFEGTQDPQAMINFYDMALKNRGWQRSESTDVMEEARKMGIMPSDIGSIHIYSRGKDFITVTAQPTKENRTLVQVMEMP